MGFIAWIVVGLVAGWLAGQLMKGRRLRCGCRHHSGHPWRHCWWLGLRTVGSIEWWRNDRFHHCCICRGRDLGGDHSLTEEGLAKMTTHV